MATRRCPRCKLINPGTTTACDCGWSFVERRRGAPRQLSERELEVARVNARHAQAAQLLVIGVVMLGLGIAGLVVDIVRRVAPQEAWIILAVRGGGAALTVAGLVNVVRAIGKLAGRSRAAGDSDRG